MSDMHAPLVKNDEERFWNLIDRRAVPGADRKRIDQKIWDLFGEEWAVVFTDLAGFSQKTAQFGVLHFLSIIRQMEHLLLPIVEKHDGVLIKSEADSLFLIFRRAESAVRCAVEMQRACQKESERRSPEEQILLCIGVGYGPVLRVGTTDVWGSEVNSASILGEDTAKAHEILVTEAVKEALPEHLNVSFLDLGLAVPGSAQNYRLKYR